MLKIIILNFKIPLRLQYFVAPIRNVKLFFDYFSLKFVQFCCESEYHNIFDIKKSENGTIASQFYCAHQTIKEEVPSCNDYFQQILLACEKPTLITWHYYSFVVLRYYALQFSLFLTLNCKFSWYYLYKLLAWWF